MHKKPGRKSRGARHSVTVRIPVELVALLDDARGEETRIDYVWSLLARHFDREDLDPLSEEDASQLTLTTKPSRAA